MSDRGLAERVCECGVELRSDVQVGSEGDEHYGNYRFIQRAKQHGLLR